MLTQRPGARVIAILLLLGTVMASGCTSIPNRATVSPTCFPNGIYGGPRSDKVPINLVRLRQDPPEVYILGPRDTLGVYIEGVLGSRDQPLPVMFQDELAMKNSTSNLPPAIGYPIPIRDDGTMPLPLVPPIAAQGLTLPQLESVIRKAYTIDHQILAPGRDRIIVTLMKPRTYRVLVFREDIGLITQNSNNNQSAGSQGGGSLVLGGDRSGAGKLVELPAYENDVLHALSQSGGLPGLNAEDEVIVLRSGFKNAQELSPLLTDQPPGYEVTDAMAGGPKNVTRIRLRAVPGRPLQQLTQDDILLHEGDVIYIKSREAEVFYTGGLLKGGQHAIPRDYDLDVLGAMAVAGGSLAASSNPIGGSGRGTGVGSVFPPTRVLILRMMNGQQYTIRVDLKKALRDPTQRILIEPNDVIVLEYTSTELFLNTALNLIEFNVSVNQLFGQNGR